MNVKKIVGFLAIAFLLFFVITQPAAAAAVVQSILGTLRDAAQAIASFFRTLF